ncbi:hypothetical protein NF865_07420 [Thermococcus aggregans]|uniref:KaiC-like domain-containing protein n=1 Tax=Thermococcus aggregans TaxID=110163 RepID=A0A9E7MWE9_THEAG|nr:ATPase domain-containing protein [Thermococcus aggregans]USS40158.1 hypothetical protein NF865_07420 [Thermococcus aggregans]
MKVVKTGWEDIDEALGGGIIERGSLLIAYDKRSLGWILGLKILKTLMEKGAIGVILNTAMPVSKLELRTRCAGLDLHKLGEEGKLYVVDLFGSKYEVPSKKPYILQIPEWSDETAIAKLIDLYNELSSKIPKDVLVVALLATIEGTYYEFGEDMMHKLIRVSIAALEKEPLNAFRFITVSLVNMSAVPEHITAWLFTLSDQVIEFVSHISPSGLEETILVPKSVIPEFMPRHYKIRVSKEHFIKLF